MVVITCGICFFPIAVQVLGQLQERQASEPLAPAGGFVVVLGRTPRQPKDI